MEVIDKELIDLARQGNREAMQKMYSLTVRCLFAVSQRYVVNEDDVRDVLQEVYIKVFRAIKDFEYREGANVVSWMTRITVNESLSFLRRSSRDAFVETMPELPDEEDEMEVERFSSQQLHEAIMQLPTGYRTVLNLYVLEDKSHKEIAQLLGIKESSSASQLNRAKRQLKEILLKQEGGIL